MNAKFTYKVNPKRFILNSINAVTKLIEPRISFSIEVFLFFTSK